MEWHELFTQSGPARPILEPLWPPFRICLWINHEFLFSPKRIYTLQRKWSLCSLSFCEYQNCDFYYWCAVPFSPNKGQGRNKASAFENKKRPKVERKQCKKMWTVKMRRRRNVQQLSWHWSSSIVKNWTYIFVSALQNRTWQIVLFFLCSI